MFPADAIKKSAIVIRLAIELSCKSQLKKTDEKNSKNISIDITIKNTVQIRLLNIAAV
jgi:hypothetical protein